MDKDLASYDPPITLTRCPVESITGVWRFVREPHLLSRRPSLPGHVLHLVVAGSYKLRTDGRNYDIRAGHVIYYHGPEVVEWFGDRSGVTFYSVGFLAPSLKPLPLDRRVFPSNQPLRAAFDRLYQASLRLEGEERSFGMHAALLQILQQVAELQKGLLPTRKDTEIWWEMERRIREERLFRPTLAQLVSRCHHSSSTIVRSCRRATGLSPMQCVRVIRMEEARALILFSHLNVTQVADYLGYGRIHEFSREFSRHFGTPPSRIRSPL